MNNKEIITTDVHLGDSRPQPTYRPPQQQLWSVTPELYHHYLATVLRVLKKEAQADLCLALVAYIRFGIRRPFGDSFLEPIFGCCIDVLETL